LGKKIGEVTAGHECRWVIRGKSRNPWLEERHRLSKWDGGLMARSGKSRENRNPPYARKPDSLLTKKEYYYRILCSIEYSIRS
jgi:hypothetical protein